MREDVRYQLWILAAAALIFFVHLGGPALWDMDEALYASCAREMHDRGDWVVPMFNGQMFPEKPPLMFWTMMAGFGIFGTGELSELGARFFSAVLGIGTALVTFRLGRLLFNARVGFWAGLITVSTIIFTISARAATVDSALTFVTALAFLCFAAAGNEYRTMNGPYCRVPRVACPPVFPALLDEPGTDRRLVVAPNSTSLVDQTTNAKSTWPLFALMYACIGVAVLAKGPVGMLLPLAAMGLCLLARDGWRNLGRSVWRMRPFTALLVVAAVALPWYVWVGLRTDWEWPRQFVLEFNLRPFKQPIQGHGDVSSYQSVVAALVAVLYYFYQVPAVLVGFFPWSVFLGPTLVDTVQRLRRTDRQRTGVMLMACWFGTWFVFWSICKTKLPHYLLPAYPALALLTGCFVDRWLTEPASLRRWWLRNAWISMIVAGVSIMIAVPIVAAYVLPGEAVLGLVGLIPVVAGAWCWWKTAHQQHRQAAVGFAAASVVFLTATFGFGAMRVDRHQNARPMIAAILADGPEAAAAPLAIYRFFRYQYSTVYYADRPIGDPVAICGDADQLREFLARSNVSYVITTSEYEREIRSQFPGEIRVVDRRRRFLSTRDDDQMVVLAMTPQANAHPN